MPVRKLPTFKGYTVDRRLKQFRKAELGEPLAFIAFDSEEGQRLLEELRQEGYTTPPMVMNDQGEWVVDVVEM